MMATYIGYGLWRAYRAWLLIAAIALAALVTLSPEAPRGATTGRTPGDCAAMLGISYTVEDGATEQLDAFNACLGQLTR